MHSPFLLRWAPLPSHYGRIFTQNPILPLQPRTKSMDYKINKYTQITVYSYRAPATQIAFYIFGWMLGLIEMSPLVCWEVLPFRLSGFKAPTSAHFLPHIFHFTSIVVLVRNFADECYFFFYFQCVMRRRIDGDQARQENANRALVCAQRSLVRLVTQRILYNEILYF